LTKQAPKVKVVGRLRKRDVGLVIAVERTDGGSVYVVGPNGVGWAFGALLVVIKEAVP
jgi:hypothetical protein